MEESPQLRSEFRAERERMVQKQIRERGVRDERVLEVLRGTPRHLFVEADKRGRAYDDEPIPIGAGQTISQPYTVAFMTEALGLRGGEKVLEIGTGSGYQTAILSELAGRVYTIERIEALAERAKRLLANFGRANVFFRVGDGTLGWPEEAPFDAVLVTAGSPEAPAPLVRQLGEGGRLVIPTGKRGLQNMIRLTKRDGETRRETLGQFKFVDLIGEYGWTK